MTPHPAAGEFQRLNELPEGRRLEVLQHAESCAPCRLLLTRDDPTAIFGLLALQPIPEFALARLGRDLDAAIDADRGQQRYGGRRVAALAASIAASLILALFFGYHALQHDPTRLAASSDSTGKSPERGLELISSPGQAEVVDFSVGETHVVMIFDKALDI